MFNHPYFLGEDHRCSSLSAIQSFGIGKNPNLARRGLEPVNRALSPGSSQRNRLGGTERVTVQ
jgi:hypothetical protein